GQGHHLAVVASPEVDAEVMSLAMHNLVQQVGQKLTAPVRGEFDAFGTGDGQRV
ncbi:roadblock/LC7 domain-containing protein, partial [Streptomyces griseolus]|nr:roadblock/LC7 domain-containing protein [Streptomyces griseolus]